MSPSVSSMVTSKPSRSKFVTHVATKLQLVVELGPGQARADHLEVAERVLLEELAGDVGDRQVEARQLLRQLEHLGRRVGVLEAAGVGDEPGVEAQGGVAGERPAEPAGQLAHDDRGGGRVRRRPR